MKILPSESLMIAAHGWDINGATLARPQTAFIKRFEKELSDFYYKPDYCGNDCLEIIKNLKL